MKKYKRIISFVLVTMMLILTGMHTLAVEPTDVREFTDEDLKQFDLTREELENAIQFNETYIPTEEDLKRLDVDCEEFDSLRMTKEKYLDTLTEESIFEPIAMYAANRISGRCYVESLGPTDFASGSPSIFNVKMPDGKKYKGFCQDPGMPQPINGWYDFTGSLNRDGSYTIACHTQRIGGIEIVNPYDRPYLIYGGPPYKTQRVGGFNYRIPPENGYAQLKKTSANPDLTNGSDCYSLAGAEYGIYSDQSCTKKVKSFTTDANGNSNKVELKAGAYWVKETKAPKGYALDKRTYKINVVANQTSELKVTDIPTMDPVGVLLGKIDKETNQNKPQGSASLENAHFEMKFYKGLWQKDVDPATLGKTPARKWVFKTDKDGFCTYHSNSLVSGDSLYVESDGIPSLPVGTLTIQEVKAPEGYQINPTIYVVQIKDDGTHAESINTYNIPTIPEAILKLDIVKKVQGKEIVIPGAVFTHTKPNGSKETYTTDSKGQISIKGLERGKHTIEETSVPDGFVKNNGMITFTVTDDSKIQLNSNTSTDDNGKMTFTVETDGNGKLVVEDIYTPYTLQLTKENDQSKLLEGAEFTLYSDKSCSTILQKKKTEKDGTLKFTDLKVDTLYYLKETKAPKGYRIPVNTDGSEIIYEIKTSSNPVEGSFEYFVNRKKQEDSQITGTVDNRVVNLKIVNYIGLKMPETGTHISIVIFLIGIGCMTYGILRYVWKKKTKDN